MVECSPNSAYQSPHSPLHLHCSPMATSTLVTSYLKSLSDYFKDLLLVFQEGPSNSEVWGKCFIDIWVSFLVLAF